MAKKKVFWTPVAIDSLRSTSEFIINLWNEGIVDNFLELIDKRIEQVQDNPEIAPRINKTNFRKLIIHKNVSLFYTLDTDIIKILLIWDNRQNPQDLFQKLTAANERGM